MKAGLFSACFFTLGCRLNQLETEEIAAAFRAEGFATERLCAADTGGGSSSAIPLLCIINTCAVTAKAEQKARRVARLALKRGAAGDAFAAVIVTGCYAQTDGEKIRRLEESGSSSGGGKAAPEGRLMALPGKLKGSLKNLARALRLFLESIDASIEASAAPSHVALKGLVSGFCRDFCLKEEKAASKPFSQFEGAAEAADLFVFHSRAAVKIQDGCSSACTFCKTRIARGPSVSVASDEIIARVRQIESSGWGEAVLTGVNLCQYKDPVTGAGLAGLLALLLESTNSIFIRLSSLYPENVTPEFASIVSDSRICPFFHLSIQSASEKIIRLMGRSYSARQVREAVALLRGAKRMPFISCDIIAGFPQETEEDFMMTESLCAELDFAHIHVFPFSPREGTAAALMKGRVHERVSRERVRRLEAISREGKRRYCALWEGETLPGVFEYSRETKEAKVFTVNALSLPLECSEFLREGGRAAELLMESPQLFKGAPVLARIGGGNKACATLLGFAGGAFHAKLLGVRRA